MTDNSNKPTKSKAEPKSAAPAAPKPATPADPGSGAAVRAPAPEKAATTAKAAPAAAKPAAPMKPVAPKRLVTTITALIDVGFGNALFLRGEGPGLSWDRGVALECADSGKWSISLAESSRPVVCKFLINDSDWNLGNDYTVAPGTSITITPVF